MSRQREAPYGAWRPALSAVCTIEVCSKSVCMCSEEFFLNFKKPKFLKLYSSFDRQFLEKVLKTASYVSTGLFWENTNFLFDFRRKSFHFVQKCLLRLSNCILPVQRNFYDLTFFDSCFQFLSQKKSGLGPNNPSQFNLAVKTAFHVSREDHFGKFWEKHAAQKQLSDFDQEIFGVWVNLHWQGWQNCRRRVLKTSFENHQRINKLLRSYWVYLLFN